MQKRGLVRAHVSVSEFRGITLDEKTVTGLESMCAGEAPVPFSEEEIAQFEDGVYKARHDLVLNARMMRRNLDGLPPPEPTGEEDPHVRGVLNQAF